MPEIFPQKEFWKLYNQLPKDIQETLLSKQTNDYIWQICENFDLDVDVAKFNRLVANVLLGLVPPDEFGQILQEELGLTPKTAKKISFAVYRYIFYPVKNSLSDIYQMEIKAPAGAGEIKKIKLSKPEKQITPQPRVRKRPEVHDIYRENIE